MKLLFVYNAKSGFLNQWIDSAHKILQPATYDCVLCSLTHGSFKEKKVWKRFRESSDHELTFLYKDDFLRKYRSKWLPRLDFPVVLIETDHELEVFISSEILEKLESAEALITAISEREAMY